MASMPLLLKYICLLQCWNSMTNIHDKAVTNCHVSVRGDNNADDDCHAGDTPEEEDSMTSWWGVQCPARVHQQWPVFVDHKQLTQGDNRKTHYTQSNFLPSFWYHHHHHGNSSSTLESLSRLDTWCSIVHQKIFFSNNWNYIFSKWHITRSCSRLLIRYVNVGIGNIRPWYCCCCCNTINSYC